ncbi:MAG: polyphenol oxidase family protein [Bdellovibrionales bacterium]|nr:polyphenol oxidase family protein [Bdellovibrionales bacterium]
MWIETRGPSNEILCFHQEVDGAKFYFGTRHLPKEQLSKLYPQWRFCFLKQVHGANVVEANPEELFEADGHFTSLFNQALVIQTADCVPILLMGSRKIGAVHAGWRGVQKEILRDAIKKIQPVDHVFIGPHIGPKSFEVGLEVVQAFENRFADLEGWSLPHHCPDKRYLHLSKMVEYQISLWAPQVSIKKLELDTFTHSEMASYRRSGGSKERQFSFCVLTG